MYEDGSSPLVDAAFDTNVAQVENDLTVFITNTAPSIVWLLAAYMTMGDDEIVEEAMDGAFSSYSGDAAYDLTQAATTDAAVLACVALGGEGETEGEGEGEGMGSTEGEDEGEPVAPPPSLYTPAISVSSKKGRRSRWRRASATVSVTSGLWTATPSRVRIRMNWRSRG